MAQPTDSYQREILDWRAEREADLRKPNGWLSLVGLHWLSPGPNRVPGLSARIFLQAGQVRLVADHGAELARGDSPVRELVLHDDAEGDPTVVTAGTLSFHLIRRGHRLGIRVRDSDAPALREFRGLDYFPVDPRLRAAGRFEASEERAIDVPNVLGDVEREPSPGSVEFTVAGTACRLDALEGDEGGLWLVFGDATNRVETYDGGRFLKTDPPAEGSVVLDFNRAYNPPCVFTPYATCPLPPAQNRLSVPIRAGERGYARAHH